MATRTPKGTAARRTTKPVAARPDAVPPAEEKVPAAPAAVETTKAEAPAPVAPVAPVVEPAPAEEPATDAPAPAQAALAGAVEEVTAPVPVEEPVAPAAPKAPAAKAKRTPRPAAPKIPQTAAKPAAAPAALAPVAVTKPVPAAAVSPDVGQAIAYTKEKVEKMSKQVFASFDDVVGFQKDNVEAFVASSQILTKGLEALSKEIAAFTQAQYEQSVATTKALFAVKSVKELVDLQTEFAKTSFDAFVAEATKVSETGFKVANEAAEPLTARVNATVEKLSKIKAA
ncbi:phasin family protein [Niveispirillum fermenti]|uniref:phasin family protein n=1 Tax=Niveispirillum fermenti TaxID=1233113 RepID=UPI003A845B0A